MAINVRERGTVGCAYYVAREEKLYCMEDVKLGGAEIVQALKAFSSPTVIVIPFNLDDAILDLVDIQRNDDNDDDEQSSAASLPYNIEFRVAGDFKYETALDKLMNLRIGRPGDTRMSFMVPGDVAGTDDPEDFGEDSAGRVGQLLSISSSIDMESHLSVGCIGAILNYIGRRRNAAFIPGDAAAHNFFRVSGVEMFSLGGFMFINLDTLVSLQIIQSESHPHSQNQGPKNSGAKEGLSIYGLFQHFARTPQGKSLLRQYFLRPSINIDVINERLDTITLFTAPANQPLMDKMVSHLKVVKNMRTVMINLRKGNSGGITPGRSSGLNRTIWSSIREFLYRALETKQALGEMNGAHRLKIFEKVKSHFDGPTMSQIGNMIGNTIDFELSIEQHRTVVKPGVDIQLDEAKRTHDGMDHLLSHVAVAIAQEVPSVVDAQLNVIFFPQIGFLISVRRIPDTTSGAYAGEENDPWEQMFYTGDYVYYKDSKTREMDAQFGDVYGSICDREIEIIQDLAEKVLEHEALLTTVSDICGELDCLLALAQGAREYNLCRPHMTEENTIQIQAGRHLLQERTVPTFIANDTLLVGGRGNDANTMQDLGVVSQYPEGPSMMMLTGPNYSGKSVYLKQVALITFMAHIGSFVPAERATIGLTDKILTHGAGLAAGIFTHLLSLGPESPKVLAATHHHEIFPHLPPTPHLSYHQMQIHLAPSTASSTSSSASEDQITYLYALQAGRSSSSYGTVCARMNGVPEDIVRHAEEVIGMAERGEDLVAVCARVSEGERGELRDAEAVARRFLTGDIGGDAGGEGGGVRGWLGGVLEGDVPGG
ncbi:MutS domain V-containing protein 1 [Elsinoe australis]|uniref:MutS domain V-containing protein 1 n=1 Tax=Elsinoe australis TaxID=40998 RepID=A0A4U7BAM2_9PEZI|nr:MutS domain V-containing protein 1 [Elsinoe australis]